MNNEENLYKILNINEKSTNEEIKKAYRKLSLLYHPDRQNGDSERFKKINDAYTTLSDQELRKKYDYELKNPNFPFFSSGGSPDDIFADIFVNHFMNSGMFPGLQPEFFNIHGNQNNPNVKIYHNGVPLNFGGSGGMFLEKPSTIIKNVTITMDQVLIGSVIPIDIERWIIENGNKIFEKEIMYIDIPKGIDNGEIIVFKNKGNVINENNKGDIKVVVNVNNDTDFIREGIDLIYKKSITLKECLCGFSFELKYINGKIYTLNNESGNIIVPDYRKVISKLGLSRDNHQGNLIIVFNVEFPKTLSIETINKLKEIM